MDFGFTEEQEMFRRVVRDFAKKELAPGSLQRAESDVVPPELIKKLGDNGLLGINVPEEYGGQPADWISAGIMAEEFGRVDQNMTQPMVGTVGTYLALSMGSEELRQEWLPALCAGEKTACIAMTEPDCGADAAAIKTKAEKDGDYYVITGEKTAITRGMHADVAMLWAKTDPAAGPKGVSMFMVPLDLPGITKERQPHAGYKPLAAATLVLDEVRVPAKNLVGKEGVGFFIVMGQFDFFRAILSLLMIGAAQASLEETIEYTKQRIAFGRPIATNQGVSFKIAEGATMLDAARMLAYRALWLKDQGKEHSTESAMAKWFTTEAATQIIHNTITIHGHAGYSNELPLVHRMLNCLGAEIYEGPAQIQKLIIARDLIGREVG